MRSRRIWRVLYIKAAVTCSVLTHRRENRGRLWGQPRDTTEHLPAHAELRHANVEEILVRQQAQGCQVHLRPNKEPAQHHRSNEVSTTDMHSTRAVF